MSEETELPPSVLNIMVEKSESKPVETPKEDPIALLAARVQYLENQLKIAKSALPSLPWD